MITSQLLHPASIVVVGASNNVHKPGGAILKNLLSGGYTGELRAVNPKETEVQGVAAFADVKDIPQDIFVGEHDSFRESCGTRCIIDDGQFVQRFAAIGYIFCPEPARIFLPEFLVQVGTGIGQPFGA